MGETCRICGGDGYLDTSAGMLPCRCSRLDPRSVEMEMVLVGYENMGPEGDHAEAVAHLCELLRDVIRRPSPSVGVEEVAREIDSGAFLTVEDRVPLVEPGPKRQSTAKAWFEGDEGARNVARTKARSVLSLLGGSVGRDISSRRTSFPAGSPEGETEAQTPIDMILFCPACGLQHTDEPNGDWTNPPHRSHLCHGCGRIWRPADVPTNGVAAIKTKGKADSLPPLPSPTPSTSAEPSGGWSDSKLETYARGIVSRRGKYRYAYTEERAFRIVLDVLLDFRDSVQCDAGDAGGAEGVQLGVERSETLRDEPHPAPDQKTEG